MKSPVGILTDAVIGVLNTRPWGIQIVAHVDARASAKRIKEVLPQVRLARHRDIGAKELLIAADTVWILRNDFGKRHRLDSGVGFHSPEVYEKTRLQLFERARREAQETL